MNVLSDNAGTGKTTSSLAGGQMSGAPLPHDLYHFVSNGRYRIAASVIRTNRKAVLAGGAERLLSDRASRLKTICSNQGQQLRKLGPIASVPCMPVIRLKIVHCRVNLNDAMKSFPHHSPRPKLSFAAGRSQ
ncbi:hypothetical protein [Sinorhizobium arboris]|uniref:hypothetical protein n=1 Tax=Sinorhizobium arboris TaxID=76745 RepID=UPI0004208D6B|nr:hypothetical protein [Sinorhizobium arboris]